MRSLHISAPKLISSLPQNLYYVQGTPSDHLLPYTTAIMCLHNRRLVVMWIGFHCPLYLPLGDGVHPTPSGPNFTKSLLSAVFISRLPRNIRIKDVKLVRRSVQKFCMDFFESSAWTLFIQPIRLPLEHVYVCAKHCLKAITVKSTVVVACTVHFCCGGEVLRGHFQFSGEFRFPIWNVLI